MALEGWIAQGIGAISLLAAGVALILIEIWGIKKIWKLIKGDEKS